jgi:hypothetical protein
MTQSLLCQKNQQKRAIHTAAALSLYSLRDVKALGTKAATPQNEYLPTASRRKGGMRSVANSEFRFKNSARYPIIYSYIIAQKIFFVNKIKVY